MDFKDYNFDDIKKALKDLSDKGTDSALAFKSGDHWQKNEAWIGPRPKANSGDATDVLKEIERGLVSQNAVKEIVERHCAAVIGREPDWGFTVRRPLGKVKELVDGQMMEVDEKPNPKEQALIDEAEAALTEFWDKRELLNLLHDAVENLVTAGRSAIRLFIPRGLIGENGAVPQGDLAQSFDLLFLNLPEYKQATVVLDADTQRRAGVYLTEEMRDNEKIQYAEISFILDGKTFVRGAEENKEPQDSIPLELDGHLTIFEMNCKPLVSAQVRQHQCLLNMARTMMARNVVLAGFLERMLFDVEMPGEWQGSGEGRKWVPNPLYVGAGSTNIYGSAVLRDENGKPILDEHGKPTVLKGSAQFRDPVPVTTFEETASAAYLAILKEARQLHAMIAGDATASGESRKQAMDDFRKSLEPTKAQIDACGRWLLETSLAIAAQFSGQPGKFAELRAVFDSQVDVGRLTSEEINTMQAEVEKKLRSRENYMVAADVTDDTDAELSKISAENSKLNPIQDVQLERQKLGLKQDQRATDAGISSRIDAGTQDATQQVA